MSVISALKQLCNSFVAVGECFLLGCLGVGEVFVRGVAWISAIGMVSCVWIFEICCLIILGIADFCLIGCACIGAIIIVSCLVILEIFLVILIEFCNFFYNIALGLFSALNRMADRISHVYSMIYDNMVANIFPNSENKIQKYK